MATAKTARKAANDKAKKAAKKTADKAAKAPAPAESAAAPVTETPAPAESAAAPVTPEREGNREQRRRGHGRRQKNDRKYAHNLRARYYTTPKPEGGTFDVMGTTALWDLGTSPDIVHTYFLGGPKRAKGPAGTITFKLSSEDILDTEVVKKIFRSPPKLDKGKEGDAEAIAAHEKAVEEYKGDKTLIKTLFHHTGRLADAPPELKRLARRAKVYFPKRYAFDYDRDIHDVSFVVPFHQLNRARVHPATLVSNDSRGRPTRKQEAAGEKGWLKTPKFVWVQTIQEKPGVYTPTGWVVVGIGDLDYPDRPYDYGGVIVFPPYMFRLNPENKGEKTYLSIVEILHGLIIESGWLLEDVLGYYKAIRPETFSNEKLGVKADEEVVNNDDDDDEEEGEVKRWSDDETDSAADARQRPLKASIGDAQRARGGRGRGDDKTRTTAS